MRTRNTPNQPPDILEKKHMARIGSAPNAPPPCSPASHRWTAVGLIAHVDVLIACAVPPRWSWIPTVRVSRHESLRILRAYRLSGACFKSS